MDKQEFIARLEKVENGKTDTGSKVLNVVHDLYESTEIFNYNDWAMDGMSIWLEHSVHKSDYSSKTNQIEIDWDIQKNEKGDLLYFYEIS